MATVQSFSKTGSKQEAAVKLAKEVFGFGDNSQLIAQAYNTYLANGRSAAASTLKRGEVSGGGKKPWRQKGTGRARVGSSRVPHWRGGGVAFGPTGEQNYTLGINQKMKRQAIREALSLKAAAGAIAVIESFDSTDGKVKPAAALLMKLGLEGRILLVVTDRTPLLDRATRNLAGVQVITAGYLNVFNVMNADHLLFTAAALDAVKAGLGGAK